MSKSLIRRYFLPSLVHGLRESEGVYLMGLHFLVLEVLAGIFLEAIALPFRFAQVLDLLINIGLSCLVVEIFLRQEWLICYNFCGSRKCTLKTKYDIVYRRGRLQSL